VIRDPRDVIVSGANYHCKADEPWLHIPEKRFGGLTYHQKINSLTSAVVRSRTTSTAPSARRSAFARTSTRLSACGTSTCWRTRAWRRIR
jgi:hypothetical protein